MAAEILRTMRQLLLASIVAQLMLVGGGMLALAVVLAGSGAVGAAMALEATLPALLVMILVTTSGRAARRTLDGYESTPTDLLEDAVRVGPRVVTQVGALLLGCTGAWFVAMTAATLHPLAGLVALPLALVASAAACAPLLLAIGAIASGDQGWLPGAAFELLRRTPLPCLGLAAAGVVLSSMLALPIALTGLIVSVLVGPAGVLGFGLAAVSVVPWLGCGSVAAWRVLGGDQLLGDRLARSEAAEDQVSECASGSAALQALVSPVGAAAWAAGPTWDVAVDAGASFGTWVRMPAAARVGLAVTWHAGTAPELSIAGPDGAWWRPGEPAGPGQPLLVDLPAGDSYLQCTSRSGIPQALTIAILLPTHAAA